jgi:hypothetical protein
MIRNGEMFYGHCFWTCLYNTPFGRDKKNWEAFIFNTILQLLLHGAYLWDKNIYAIMRPTETVVFFLWLYSFLDFGRFFSFVILYTGGRTPWTGDQPFARPLSTPRTTQTQKKTHTDIHVSNGIRSQDPSALAGEDGSCLRTRGHCDRTEIIVDPINEVDLDFNGEKSKRPMFMSRYESAEKDCGKYVKVIVAGTLSANGPSGSIFYGYEEILK